MTEENKAAMSPEQAADFAAISAAASAGQEMPTAEGAQGSAPAGADVAGEIKALVLAFVAIAKPILPSLSTIYTEEATGAAAGAVAAVCQKHGWLQNGLLGDYSEEIAAAVVLLPLALATVNGIKADMAANNAKRKEKQPEVIEAPKEKGQEGEAKPDPSLQGWQPPITGSGGDN